MSDPVLTLVIAGRRVAIDATAVHSVVELGSVSPVPLAPAYIVGLSALRSAAMTVVDCAAALGIEQATQAPEGRRAAVIEADGQLYALLVDSVDDVVEIDGEPLGIPGDAGRQWIDAALGMVETAGGPALLIDPCFFLRGETPAMAA